MSILKHSFLKFEKIGETIKRFYLPFGLLISLFLMVSYMTLSHIEQEKLKYFFKIELVLVFGVSTCTLAKVFYEKYFLNKFNKFIFDGVALTLSVAFYIFLNLYDVNVFITLALAGITTSEMILILYVSRSDCVSETFSYYLKNMLFNSFACTVIFCGMSICIFAFTTLVYNFKNSFKAYIVCAEFIQIVLSGSMFLSIIPVPKQKLSTPRAFKILVSKMMLPIYSLLLMILYLYLGRILIIRTFPSGQVNWIVSFSSLLFIFFVFSLSQYKNENKAINMFLKFGALAIIPTIIMQFVAIYIRVSNYGLTTLRYASIILNVFALIFALVFLFKRERSLKYTLLVLVGFILLATVTPLNIIDVPVREQSNRLKNLLLHNGMFSNNKIIPNKNLDQDEKNKIIESYSYLKNNFEVSNYKPSFLDKDLINKSENEIFGFEESNLYGQNSFYSSAINFYYNYDFIDLSGYSKLYNLSDSIITIEDNNVVLKGGSKEDILVEGLYDYLKDIYSKYKGLNKNSVDTEKIEYEFGHRKVVLSTLSLYEGKNGKLSIGYHRDCYLLEK